MTDTTTPAPAAPTMNDKIRGWVHTGFAGVLTGIASTAVIQLPAALKPTAPMVTEATVNNAVATVVNPANPQFKSAAESVLLQFVQSGVPGTAIQTGAGLIPGAAPFATLLEPIVRKQVIDFLQQQQTKKR